MSSIEQERNIVDSDVATMEIMGMKSHVAVPQRASFAPFVFKFFAVCSTGGARIGAMVFLSRVQKLSTLDSTLQSRVSVCVSATLYLLSYQAAEQSSFLVCPVRSSRASNKNLQSHPIWINPASIVIPTFSFWRFSKVIRETSRKHIFS